MKSLIISVLLFAFLTSRPASAESAACAAARANVAAAAAREKGLYQELLQCRKVAGLDPLACEHVMSPYVAAYNNTARAREAAEKACKPPSQPASAKEKPATKTPPRRTR